MPSIAAICNAYNESSAISGWLENVSSFADHVTVYHTGPGGERSNDGTIEICEKFGVHQEWGSIDDGFGAVRSRMITMTPCEWVFIMDCDERFLRWAPRLRCEGTDRYPEVQKPNLRVTEYGTPYDQLTVLKSFMTPEYDAVCAIRRHWFTAHYDAPCENWMTINDWQMRIVRNCDHVVYTPVTRMHERITDLRNPGHEPRFRRATVEEGPFHEHLHCFFKPMETEQRQHDIAVYDSLNEGKKPPTLEEFRAGNTT